MDGNGGRPSASVWTLAIGAIIGMACGLWTEFAASTVDETWIGEHTYLIWSGMVIFAVLAVAQLVREQGRLQAGDPADDEIADALAAAVRTDRARFLDQALGMRSDHRPTARVGFAHPAPGDLDPDAMALLTRWQAPDGASGEVTAIAAHYLREPHGRLVVLGAPGSGKTIALSLLVLGLLDHRAGTNTGRVPVLFSLTSFDPAELATRTDQQLVRNFEDWLVARLEQDYQVPARHARRLIEQRIVLPVLDGLDEIDLVPADAPLAHPEPQDPDHQEGRAPTPRPRARAVLRALSVAPRHPVVLACRRTDYDALTRPGPDPASSPALLNDAGHITLQPLTPSRIIDYLTARFAPRNGSLPLRWQPVADVLADPDSPDHGPLVEVLSNPWELFVAVAAYLRETSTPADLLGKPAARLRDQLVAGLIPATVADDALAAAHGWTPQRATGWLANIARYVGGTGRGEIELAELWRLSNRRWPRFVPAATVAAPYLVVGVMLAVGFRNDPAAAAWGGLALVGGLAIGLLGYVDRARHQRLDLRRLTHPRGRARLARNLAVGLAFGLAPGLALGLALGLTDGLAAGLAFGLVLGLVLGLADGLSGDVAANGSPRALRRQCLQYVLSVGLLRGLGGGLAVGLALGLTDGLATGLMGGLATGLAFGPTAGLFADGIVWWRYGLGTRSAARQGLLPRDTTGFLTWCLERGLLRTSGVHYQFRHRHLQDWLARQASQPPPPPMPDPDRRSTTTTPTVTTIDLTRTQPVTPTE